MARIAASAEIVRQLAGTRLVMPKRVAALLSGIAAFVAVASPGSRAGTITFGPGADPGIALSRVFAPLAAGGEIGGGYVGFGVDFSRGGREGAFCDEYLGWVCTMQAFGGIDGSGELDLITQVDGRIVVPGTLAQGAHQPLPGRGRICRDRSAAADGVRHRRERYRSRPQRQPARGPRTDDVLDHGAGRHHREFRDKQSRRGQFWRGCDFADNPDRSSRAGFVGANRRGDTRPRPAPPSGLTNDGS